jgi:hypothetical protein
MPKILSENLYEFTKNLNIIIPKYVDSSKVLNSRDELHTPIINENRQHK